MPDLIGFEEPATNDLADACLGDQGVGPLLGQVVDESARTAIDRALAHW